ncbi:hypothetical protein AKJ08_0718 [Vulgatibacter incomptus]|uniref:Translocation and assembly module TamB C-terminal domain-containing protein n=1 Tax=Vulgatibacter incomptus TaxID=1391653 RepID=A0A0K1PA91_9BACT|nr:hypothetical protein AKJ08_0718 [Vulgatibacter incomptus]
MLVLRTKWAANELCSRGETVISRLLGEPLSIERCEIDPVGMRFEARNVRFGGKERPEVSVRRLAVELSPLGSSGALFVRSLEIDEPVLTWTLPPGDGGSGEGPSASCLSFFDHVKVGSLSVRDARARLLLDGGSKAVEVEGLTLAVKRRGPGILPNVDLERRPESYHATLAVSKARYREDGGLSIPLDAFSAAVSLEPRRGRLAVDELHAAAPGLELSARGEIRDLCTPILDLTLGVKATLEQAAPLVSMSDLSGRLEATATLTGPAAEPETTAKVSLRSFDFHGYAFGDLDVDLGVKGKLLRVDELVWPVGDGRARITAELQLEGDLPVQVEVRTESLEFQRLLTHLHVQNTPVLMTVDSTHRLGGHLAGGFVLEGQSYLELRGFHVRNVPWHAEGGTRVVEIPGKATLQTRTRVTATDIFLDPARLSFGPGTELEMSARLGFNEERGLTIRARAPHFDLAHVASHVAGLPVAGVGSLSAVVDGPYADPRIEGDLDLAAARFFAAELGAVRSRVVSYPGRHTLDFESLNGVAGGTAYEAGVKLVLGAEPTIDARIALREGGSLGDVFAATAGMTTPMAWLRDNLDGKVRSVTARVSGPITSASGRARIEARDARFLDRPFDELRATVVLQNLSSLGFEEVRLTRGEGIAEGGGEIRFANGKAPQVEAELDAKDLPIRDLLGDFGVWADLAGKVGGSVRFGGTTDALTVSGEISGRQLSSHGVKLSSTKLSLETQGNEVIVRGALAKAGFLSAAVRMSEGLPFDANFDLDVADLSRFLPKDMGLGGAVRGTVTSVGTLSAIGAASGGARLSEVSLVSGDFKAASTGPVNLTYAGTSFSLEGIELRGPNTRLSLHGVRSRTGALDFQAQGSFDARLVEKLLPQIEHAAGVIDLKASILGDGERPILVGSAQVRDGAFRVKALPIVVERLQSKIAFSQNQVVVEDGRLVLNGGSGELRGTMSLRNWAPDRFDLVLDGSQMSWRKPDDWPATVSGRVAIGGTWPDKLLLSGEVTVDRLRYAKELDLEKAILDFRKKFHAAATSEEPERIRFDLDLVGGRDMRVDNSLVKARLQFVASPGGRAGRLKLVGSNVRIGLLGSVEVVDATAFFRGNTYRITHGMVDFAERDRIDPTFDLTAETQVRDYRVAAHAYGRLDDGAGGMGYQLDLRSEPMLAQSDIVTLLTFGITSWDLDKGGNAGLGGLAAEALMVVSGLDEHVKKLLPQTPLLMDPDLSVTSQYSELTGQMEPFAVFEAKVLSERLKLKAAAPFSTSRGRRASAEVTVSDKLSTQLVWQNEVIGYSSGDLGLDLKLRWEWE